MWMDNWVLNLPFEKWPQLEDASEPHERVLFRFFESKRPVVVLANSNSASVEADVSTCERLSVPILTRKGGGGTVVLMPGCLILTFAFHAKELFSNNTYFELINGLWIDALSNAGVSGLVQAGISDIAHNGKKVAGTSLFRKKHLAVYQGSLLVSPDFTLIEKCLKHPSREPDYRNNRSHGDFLTSLHNIGLRISTAELARHCESYFKTHARKKLVPHLWKEASAT